MLGYEKIELFVSEMYRYNALSGNIDDNNINV